MRTFLDHVVAARSSWGVPRVSHTTHADCAKSHRARRDRGSGRADCTADGRDRMLLDRPRDPARRSRRRGHTLRRENRGRLRYRASAAEDRREECLKARLQDAPEAGEQGAANTGLTRTGREES